MTPALTPSPTPEVVATPIPVPTPGPADECGFGMVLPALGRRCAAGLTELRFTGPLPPARGLGYTRS